MMSLSPGTHQPIMGDNPKLQQLQLEIDDVTKQIMKVLANSSSVEAAIAGNGTYRGYSGEDVFLKHNLWAVQKEMMKQLRRQQRKLEKQKAQLLQQVSPVPPAVGGAGSSKPASGKKSAPSVVGASGPTIAWRPSAAIFPHTSPGGRIKKPSAKAAEAAARKQPSTGTPTQAALTLSSLAGKPSASAGTSPAAAVGKVIGTGAKATGAADKATGAAGMATGAKATGAAVKTTGAPAVKATGAAGKAIGAAVKATGVAGKATGATGKVTGAIGKATGATGKATGAVGKVSEAVMATGAVGTASGAGGKASGEVREATINSAAGKATGAVGKATGTIARAAGVGPKSAAGTDGRITTAAAAVAAAVVAGRKSAAIGKMVASGRLVAKSSASVGGSTTAAAAAAANKPSQAAGGAPHTVKSTSSKNGRDTSSAVGVPVAGVAGSGFPARSSASADNRSATNSSTTTTATALGSTAAATAAPVAVPPAAAAPAAAACGVAAAAGGIPANQAMAVVGQTTNKTATGGGGPTTVAIAKQAEATARVGVAVTNTVCAHDKTPAAAVKASGAMVGAGTWASSTATPPISPAAAAAAVVSGKSTGAVAATATKAKSDPSTAGTTSTTVAAVASAAKPAAGFVSAAGSAASALGPATPFHLPVEVIAGAGGKPNSTPLKSGGAVAGKPPPATSVPATATTAAATPTKAAVTPTPAKGSTEKGSGRKKSKKRDFSSPPAGRVFKTPRRGQPESPGPAHSVEEYLANTKKGIEAVASITAGTVFWIKFSDTKEAWLECGVVAKVYPKSAVPYEVDWRPFDSSGCELAVNPRRRIALTPRLFVASSGIPELAGKADPPAGTAAREGFELAHKKFRLTVPPIGSWSIVEPSQPWGQLGPFAF